MIQRYDAYWSEGCNDDGTMHLLEKADGRVVLFSDHAALVEKLVKALESIASDFETDFVADGAVVDRPYTSHIRAWKVARAAIAAAKEAQ